MRDYKCAICEKRVNSALVCSECSSRFDINEAWVQALTSDERDSRNQKRRMGFTEPLVLSEWTTTTKDGGYRDGWQIIEDDFVVSVFESNAQEEAQRQSDLEFILIRLCNGCRLTKKEWNALAVYVWYQNPHSSRAAHILSEIEQKPISAETYRRRLSDIKVKVERMAKADPQVREVVVSILDQ